VCVFPARQTYSGYGAIDLARGQGTTAPRRAGKLCGDTAPLRNVMMTQFHSVTKQQWGVATSTGPAVGRITSCTAPSCYSSLMFLSSTVQERIEQNCTTAHAAAVAYPLQCLPSTAAARQKLQEGSCNINQQPLTQLAVAPWVFLHALWQTCHYLTRCHSLA